MKWDGSGSERRASCRAADTHIWLRWLLKDADPVSEKLVSLIDEADEIGVSSVSCWEVAYLHKRNRLELPVNISEWINAALEGSGVR